MLVSSGDLSASAFSRAQCGPRNLGGKILDLRRGNAKCAKLLSGQGMQLPQRGLVAVGLNPVADCGAHRSLPQQSGGLSMLAVSAATVSGVLLGLVIVVSRTLRLRPQSQPPRRYQPGDAGRHRASRHRYAGDSRNAPAKGLMPETAPQGPRKYFKEEGGSPSSKLSLTDHPCPLPTSVQLKWSQIRAWVTLDGTQNFNSSYSRERARWSPCGHQASATGNEFPARGSTKQRKRIGLQWWSRAGSNR